jgi:hypothetical protein
MGRPVDVDPGQHALRAEIDGEVVQQAVVISPGERGRIVVLSTAVAGTVCGLRQPVAMPAPFVVTAREGPASPPQEPRRTIPPIVYALGGLGLVSLGFSTGFGISAWSQKGSLDDCKGSCASRDVDTMRRTFLVADITLGVGVVALAAAAVIHLTRGETRAASPEPRP